jgi:hypothetical protein
MTSTHQAFGTAAAGLLASFALATGASAAAQASHSISRTDSVQESVTVASLDPATRHLVVKRPSGELVSMKVPPEVRNFSQLKPGDHIVTTYSREIEIALLPPGHAPPKETATVVAAHAPEGEMPAAAAASRIVVTGAILAIDPKTHVVKMVNPKGGEVHEFTVVDPQGQKMMGKLKVGDKITAHVNESLLISATRPE